MRSMTSGRYGASGGRSNSPMSAPAMKVRPRAISTTPRTPSSSSKDSAAAYSCRHAGLTGRSGFIDLRLVETMRTATKQH